MGVKKKTTKNKVEKVGALSNGVAKLSFKIVIASVFKKITLQEDFFLKLT